MSILVYYKSNRSLCSAFEKNFSCLYCNSFSLQTEQIYIVSQMGARVCILYQVAFHVPPPGTKHQAWCFPQGWRVQKLPLLLLLIWKTSIHIIRVSQDIKHPEKCSHQRITLFFCHGTHQSTKCMEKFSPTIGDSKDSL